MYLLFDTTATQEDFSFAIDSHASYAVVSGLATILFGFITSLTVFPLPPIISFRYTVPISLSSSATGKDVIAKDSILSSATSIDSLGLIDMSLVFISLIRICANKGIEYSPV